MKERIEISAQYPAYWAYDCQPLMLLGGSVEDNLFQIPNLEEQLDLLQKCGGNYVRCTMSSRDDGNVWPFERLDSDLYDLRVPSQQFWGRFDRFMQLTAERDIIVQFEVWATFDFYRDNWDVNPFNPKNNVNYDEVESGLPLEVTTHPTKTENPFFWSVPNEANNTVVLQYQQAFVDELMAHSLECPNALYCMDNETSVTPEWGWYWARYIREAAEARGLKVQTTEMWDAHDLAGVQHTYTFDHPEVYTFVDISQNNHQVGQVHWDNAQKQRARISGQVRPLNNVKIYGSDAYSYGTDVDGQERFWRNVMGGMASARFHRPPAGLGISEKAQANIRSARMLCEAMSYFYEAEPHNELLSGNQENLAYCKACPGQEVAVYFARSGSIQLDASSMAGDLLVRWLDITQANWHQAELVEGCPRIELVTPAEGPQVALVQRSS